MEQKQPIVIELTTNMRTGVTALVGISAAPCRVCKSQNTTVENGELVCKEEGCKTKTKL
jgi:hypothetical protein